MKILNSPTANWGLIFLWTVVSLIISGIVVSLIIAILFAALFGNSVYLSAIRQINLIDGATDSDIAKIDGDVVLVLQTSDMGTTTETYPFTLNVK